jgi:hypothetical protein
MRPIPPFRMVPEPLNDEASKLPPFRWVEGDVGKRHQLGGEPTFLQEPRYPTCSCGKQMTFYGQLDSINDEFVIADCGMIYVFVCFECFETISILQSS